MQEISNKTMAIIGLTMALAMLVLIILIEFSDKSAQLESNIIADEMIEEQWRVINDNAIFQCKKGLTKKAVYFEVDKYEVHVRIDESIKVLSASECVRALNFGLIK